MPRWPTRSLEMRFWSKVYIVGHGFITDPGAIPRLLQDFADVCWEWRAGQHAHGYGHFKLRAREVVRCNRLALTLVLGPAPADKPFALHKCDNPPCCHPNLEKHLRWGTSAENNREIFNRFRRQPKRIELHGQQGDLIA